MHAHSIIFIGTFFLTNKKKLENNPRLWTVFSNIKKMSKEKKKQIQNDSKNFLIQITKT